MTKLIIPTFVFRAEFYWQKSRLDIKKNVSNVTHVGMRLFISKVQVITLENVLSVFFFKTLG